MSRKKQGMLDFSAVRASTHTMEELTAGMGVEDLRKLTNAMIDTQLGIIADCRDADVVFQPTDPDAFDNAASSDDEKDIAWTLGHVIVHVTASSEEAAAIAAEIARGVPDRGGRSRSEVHWTTITTIQQCRDRLEESRRMRLASLDMWPDQPDLGNRYVHYTGTSINAIQRFVSGLYHDDSHLGQLHEIVRQTKA